MRIPSAWSTIGLWIGLIGVTMPGGSAHTSGMPTNRPNVVVVVVDTLRADRLSDYGHERKTAAPLGRFRRDAHVFMNAYAPSSWTSPSTASILSGLLPARHRTDRTGRVLNGEVRTLAEALRGHGWRTGGFSFNPNVTRANRFDQGFDHFVESSKGPTDYPDISELIMAVEEWIGTGREPFFAYLQPMNVHGPYEVPREFRRRFLGRPEDGPFRYYGPLMSAILKEGDLERRKDVTPEFLRSLRDRYDAAVRYSAFWLGDFFEDLRRLGLYDDSLIVVTSDHGEELFDHGGFSHGYSLHEELIRVPMYVKLPGQRRGRRITDRVSLTDVFPTVLERVGIEPGDVDGRSWLPLLREERSSGYGSRNFPFEVSWEGRCVGRALLSGPYKLISIEEDYRGVEDETRLFRIDRDPAEENDLADDRPQKVRELERRMSRLFETHAERSVGPVPENVMDEMDQEALRSLGYLQ